jgi:hypothetical protein
MIRLNSCHILLVIYYDMSATDLRKYGAVQSTGFFKIVCGGGGQF